MFSDQMLDLSKELSLLSDLIPENVKKVLDKFNDGFAKGYNWPDKWNYRPGGPFVWSCERHHLRFGVREREHCEHCDAAQQSKAEYEAWMKGWDLGNEKKIREGRKCAVPTNEAIDAFNAGKRKSSLY